MEEYLYNIILSVFMYYVLYIESLETIPLKIKTDNNFFHFNFFTLAQKVMANALSYETDLKLWYWKEKYTKIYVYINLLKNRGVNNKLVEMSLLK